MNERIERLLRDHNVTYIVRKHRDMHTPISTPGDFARALGYDHSRITKTLLLRSGDNAFCIVVTSYQCRVTFEVIGKELGVKRMQLASPEQLSRVLGYPPKGVSPLGGDDLPVFIDNNLFAYETILIGSGEAGVEIEISPVALHNVTKATSVELSSP